MTFTERVPRKDHMSRGTSTFWYRDQIHVTKQTYPSSPTPLSDTQVLIIPQTKGKTGQKKTTVLNVCYFKWDSHVKLLRMFTCQHIRGGNTGFCGAFEGRTIGLTEPPRPPKKHLTDRKDVSTKTEDTCDKRRKEGLDKRTRTKENDMTQGTRRASDLPISFSPEDG